uniref:porin n=1 Tax=uncultured Porphyromonas sp. TaxID=159274 RepID=UPI003413B05D
LGYFAGVEYYPMEDGNLHFFLTYVGRNFKDNIADTTASTNKLLCGFIYQLPMF